MARWVPIRAEGALVLGLIGLIAGGTFVLNEVSDPSVTTRTTYGAPMVRIQRVDQGGVKPGPVQARVIEPVVPATTSGLVAAPVTTAPPVVPPKKVVVATTPNPVTAVTPDPAPADPGGGLLPPEPGTDPAPADPGGGTTPGGGGTQPCLLPPLCAPTSPDTGAPSTQAPVVTLP